MSNARVGDSERCKKRRSPPQQDDSMSYETTASKNRRITRSVARERRAALDDGLRSMMANDDDPYSAGYAQIISLFNILSKTKLNVNVSNSISEEVILKTVINAKFKETVFTNVSDSKFEFKNGVDFKSFFYYLSGFLFFDNITGSDTITKGLYNSFKTLQKLAVEEASKQVVNLVQPEVVYYYLEEDDLCYVPKEILGGIKKSKDMISRVTVYRIGATAVTKYLSEQNPEDIVAKSDLFALLYNPSKETDLSELNWRSLTVSPQSPYGGGIKKTTKPKATKPKATKTKPKPTKPKATKAAAPVITKPKAAKPTKAKK